MTSSERSAKIQKDLRAELESLRLLHKILVFSCITRHTRIDPVLSVPHKAKHTSLHNEHWLLNNLAKKNKSAQENLEKLAGHHHKLDYAQVKKLGEGTHSKLVHKSAQKPVY